MEKVLSDKLLSTEKTAIQWEYMAKIKETQKGKKAFVVTYGCQQNENDSERIRGMLFESGYEFASCEQEADIIIYNTCAIRENAEKRVLGNLGALKLIKNKKPDLIIGVCGCMMQQEKVQKRIKSRFKHVDIVFGTHSFYKLPELIYGVLCTRERVIDAPDSDGIIAEGLPINRVHGPVCYVSVMYGCNNFCSYCIVPYVRGRERSRSKEDILDEITSAADEGYMEVMLLGQNVNSYGKDLNSDTDFASLLEEVAKIEKIKRIRFMTSHPKDFNDRLIQVIRDNPKVAPQLHLPVQSGSNDVLFKMNRKYTREQYLEKIRRVRAAVPDIAITTDIIVGFPTETNEDFEDTLSLIREVRYDSIYSFIYSKRDGTPAAKMDFVLSEQEIHSNFNRLLEVQNEISAEINKSYIGKTVTVLVEGISKNDDSMMSGRSESGKIVHIKAEEGLIGKFVKVKITGAKTWFLRGEKTEEEK